jgi:hypothetical protein
LSLTKLSTVSAVSMKNPLASTSLDSDVGFKSVNRPNCSRHLSIKFASIKLHLNKRSCSKCRNRQRKRDIRFPNEIALPNT